MFLKRWICPLLAGWMLLSFVSCGVSGKEREHLDSHRWSRFYHDDEVHFRECLDEGCEAVDKASHTTQESALICGEIPKCDICGASYGGPTPHFYDESGACIRCGEKEHGAELEYFHAEDYYVIAGIGSCCFADVEISSVHMGLPVREIGDHAFSHAVGVESIVVPDTVQKIGWGAFSGCEALTSVKLPQGLAHIEGYLFKGCVSLPSVELPEGVLHIGDRAFYDCKALCQVTIPATVNQIDGSPFSGCHSLKTIVFEGTVEQWTSIRKGELAVPASVKIVCLDGELLVE